MNLNLFLDVISIENTATVSRNVFKELSSQYIKNVHVKNDSFLYNFSYPTADRVSNLIDYKMTLKLLPHQIFIMPIDFKNALATDFLSTFTILTDTELR